MKNNPKQTMHNMYSLNVLAFGGEDIKLKKQLKISNHYCCFDMKGFFSEVYCTEKNSYELYK